MKSLHNSTVPSAEKNVSDLRLVGDGDMFRLLYKASSEQEGWMKSTKALQIDGVGCVLQVTTQQRNPDGSYAVAEAVTLVPGVMIVEVINSWPKLVAMPCPHKRRPKSFAASFPLKLRKE